MKEEEAKYYLGQLLLRFRFLKITEILLMALGVGLLVFVISGFFSETTVVRTAVAIFFILLTIALKLYKTEILSLSQVQIALYLNGKFPALQESVDLILVNDPTVLQALQKQRTLNVLSGIQKDVHLPHRLGLAFLVLIAGIVSFAFVPVAPLSKQIKAPDRSPSVSEQTIKEELPSSICRIEVSIVPPSYTGIPIRRSVAPSVRIAENSTVTWNVKFTSTVNNAQLIFSQSDSVALKNDRDGGYQYSRKLADHALYQVRWRDEKRQTYHSDFYQIEVIKDLSPKVEVKSLSQFTQLGIEDKQQLELDVRMTDDYGLKDAFVTATVSKGSGEGVKFREEKLRFTRPASIGGRDLSASRTIDLHALGLEPGDELYFYVEAHDNRIPVFNSGRTETFFVSLRDTAALVTVADAGLGVDLMPDYFRSQRQIIIDTEKLIKDEKKIKKTEFNFRSNELGYDQKALRLKYGQFLGDEDESAIPESIAEQAEEAEGDEDPLKKVTHAHDTKNEHNLVPEKKNETHAHVEGEEENKDPMKEFIHQHDDQEEATFFIQSVKTKLKLALTLMWDAELHLRMYDPKKSLPYQYKILNLLKEISQDSRIYVHRTGFDPPPVKEDKRLTGELADIVNSAGHAEQEESKLKAIRIALTEVERVSVHPENIDSEFKSALESAGYELSGEALKKPGLYMESLSLMRKLVDGRIPPDERKSALLKIRKDLWNALPEEIPAPGNRSEMLHPLDRSFIKQFERE